MFTATVSVPGSATAPTSIRTLMNTAVPGLISTTFNGRVLSIQILTGAATTAAIDGNNTTPVGNNSVALLSNTTTTITAFNQNQISIDEVFLTSTAVGAVTVGIIVVVV